MINWILDKLEERIKPMIADAYKQGYEDASADVAVRLSELYQFGLELGKSDARAIEGIIDIDEPVEDDVSEAFGEES